MKTLLYSSTWCKKTVIESPEREDTYDRAKIEAAMARRKEAKLSIIRDYNKDLYEEYQNSLPRERKFK